MSEYQYRPNPPQGNPKQLRNLIVAGALVFILIIVMFKSAITIDAGQAGVLFKRFGGGVDTETTYTEGFMFIAPWNNMFIYNARQQELKEKMTVLSSNGLEITIDVSVWHQPRLNELGQLHKFRGQTYIENVVLPAVRSATRAVIGRYTPEEIYSTKREAIQSEIFDESKTILDQQFVQLNEILIRDIMLPPKIKAAIENKLEQEQASQAYEFRLTKEKQEAERRRIEAEGKAAANKILNASLTANILKEKGIQATLQLAKSPNSEIVVVGNQDGLPLILGNN